MDLEAKLGASNLNEMGWGSVLDCRALTLEDFQQQSLLFERTVLQAKQPLDEAISRLVGGLEHELHFSIQFGIIIPID